jgi:hypothetical protein
MVLLASAYFVHSRRHFLCLESLPFIESLRKEVSKPLGAVTVGMTVDMRLFEGKAFGLRHLDSLLVAKLSHPGWRMMRTSLRRLLSYVKRCLRESSRHLWGNLVLYG